MEYIKKIKFYLVSLIYMTFYHMINRFSRRSIKLDGDSNYSISLTSYGERIKTVYLTLESLANQDAPPVSITLWLSTQDILPENLPISLKRLEERGIRVNFVDENIRSYKKLYYEYLDYKDKFDYIMTVDDDVFYPNWLGSSALERAGLNTKSVVCFRSHIMKFSSKGEILPYTHWKRCKGTLECRNDVFPTGVGGVLYPVRSLSGLEDQKLMFLKYAPHADDVWFKSLSLSNGYSSSNVGHNLDHFYCVLSKQRKGLEVLNVGQGGNDIQLKATTKFFDIESCRFKHSK